MEKLLGEDIRGGKLKDLKGSGLWLKIGGKEGRVDKSYGGEAEVMRRMLELMGMERKNYVMMGRDLLCKDENERVGFRNGEFVSKEYKYVNGRI
ncbi:hypothetical protein [Staphylococcus saprophyticus]|uniref:hypothetical protein n=1 Tax=Staphylococcus saprophyticus TaxID=29385 RepID=UPI00119FCCF8|nr:hypothetical protein [Staphylococcus saprophyticus]